MYYVFNFIIYSVFGFIFEVITQTVLGFNVNSGFTFGPYTIVYGMCITIMYAIFNKIDENYSIKKWKKILLFFFLSFSICTIYEFLAGHAIEKMFGIVFWNYEKFMFNIGKYISLETSIIWGVFPILMYYFIKNKTDKIYEHTKDWMITALSSIIILDIFVSTIFLA